MSDQTVLTKEQVGLIFRGAFIERDDVFRLRDSHEALRAEVARLEQESIKDFHDCETQLQQARREAQWKPIATAPQDPDLFFWVRPRTEDEHRFTDTSGNPIIAHSQPRLHRGRIGSWGALEIATHWRPLPPAPASVPKE